MVSESGSTGSRTWTLLLGPGAFLERTPRPSARLAPGSQERTPLPPIEQLEDLRCAAIRVSRNRPTGTGCRIKLSLEDVGLVRAVLRIRGRVGSSASWEWSRGGPRGLRVARARRERSWLPAEPVDLISLRSLCGRALNEPPERRCRSRELLGRSPWNWVVSGTPGPPRDRSLPTPVHEREAPRPRALTRPRRPKPRAGLADFEADGGPIRRRNVLTDDLLSSVEAILADGRPQTPPPLGRRRHHLCASGARRGEAADEVAEPPSPWSWRKSCRDRERDGTALPAGAVLQEPDRRPR